MSCVRLIFSFARWKILKNATGREKNVEGKQINLKGNVFVKSLHEIEARRKKQHQRQRNIRFALSLAIAKQKSDGENISRIQSLQRV